LLISRNHGHMLPITEHLTQIIKEDKIRRYLEIVITPGITGRINVQRTIRVKKAMAEMAETNVVEEVNVG